MQILFSNNKFTKNQKVEVLIEYRDKDIEWKIYEF